MKTMAIIAEYNPFHNGHQYHLKESLSKSGATHSLAVMSGDFVQRGEPALANKWKRAKMAVDGGINLVLELPVVNAISSAENFAHGAIHLIDQLKIVDCLSFGSESGDLPALSKIADFLSCETAPYRKTLKEKLSEGLSYPDARQRALIAHGFQSAEHQSNDILAIEYLKAMRRLDTPFETILVKRQHVDYHSTHLVNQFSSATAIRDWIKQQDFLSVRMAVPQTTYRTLTNELHYPFVSDLYPFIRHALTIQRSDSLHAIHEVSEGLENRMIRSARQSINMEDFLEGVKTRRFTMTRIKRALLNLLLAIETDEIENSTLKDPQAIRLLASDEKGLELLKRIKERSPLPIITNLNKFESKDPCLIRQLELMTLASDLYSLIKKEVQGQEYLNNPYIKK